MERNVTDTSPTENLFVLQWCHETVNKVSSFWSATWKEKEESPFLGLGENFSTEASSIWPGLYTVSQLFHDSFPLVDHWLFLSSSCFCFFPLLFVSATKATCQGLQRMTAATPSAEDQMLLLLLPLSKYNGCCIGRNTASLVSN